MVATVDDLRATKNAAPGAGTNPWPFIVGTSVVVFAAMDQLQAAGVTGAMAVFLAVATSRREAAAKAAPPTAAPQQDPITDLERQLRRLKDESDACDKKKDVQVGRSARSLES